MPAIPRYVAQNTPQGSLGIRSVDTGGQDIARGISAVGVGLRDTGYSRFAIQDADQQKKQRDALVTADAVNAKFQVQQGTRLRQRQLEAPLDVVDFTRTTQKEYDDGLAELMKGITDPFAKELITRRAQVDRERLTGDSMLFEATQGIKNRTAKVVTAREQREILVRAAPGRYGEAKAQQMAVLESAGLPPDVARQQGMEAITFNSEAN